MRRDFFKFIIYCILIVKTENYEEILKEEYNEMDKNQRFLQFYDKYEWTKKYEFIKEIQEKLTSLKL